MNGETGGYFLYHSIGLYPGKDRDMAAALAEFSSIWGAPDDGQWSRVLTLRAQFIALWESLIAAPAGSLTTAPSVTAGLHNVIGALPADRLRGRRVLVAADCFPSLHFLLAGMAERRGFTLDTVPPRPGEAWVRDEDVAAQIGPDVALTLLTLVTSTASHHCDLGALAGACRHAGSLVAVDLTQGVGIVPFSVGDQRPDIVVSTSLKWLCGAPGAGILHVKPDLLAECRPELRGWFSQPDPFSWALDSFAYAPDARRFDAGTPAPVAEIASIPALRWHDAQDAGALLRHNQALCEEIIDALPRLGLALASPRVSDRRGGSVMLRLPGGADAARVVAGLRAEGLYTDARGPILRLSPGAVTTREHVALLLGALPRLL